MKLTKILIIFVFIFFLNPVLGYAQNIYPRNVTYARLTISQNPESYIKFVDIIINVGDSIKVETASLQRCITSVITQSDYVYPCWSISTEPYRELWGSSKNIFEAMFSFQQEFGEMAEKLSSSYCIKTMDGTKIDIKYYNIAGIFYVKELTECDRKPNCSVSLDLDNWPQIRKIWYPVSVVSYSRSERRPLYQ